ncbi:MAG: DNA repair protein RecN [bacterium]
MLLKLSIENYALIHKLEIDFSSGFSVITGETGAGKSILMGALSLILGQRTDTTVLLDKNKKCIVEGLFSVKGYHLKDLFLSHGLDYEDNAIFRREIAPGGKSRAFINDTPVNLADLKEFGDRLVNIHSQHTTRTLNDSDFQLSVLDSYSDCSTLVSEYKVDFSGWIGLKKELAGLKEAESRAKGEADYFAFLLHELTDAALQPGELETIEEKLKILSHAEEIKTRLFHALEILSDNENSILKQLSSATSIISEVSRFHGQVAPLVERLHTDYVDIKDILKEVEQIYEQVVVDPGEIDVLTQRLELISRLLKKHQAVTVYDLILIKQNIENKIFINDNLEEKIKSVQVEISKKLESLFELSGKISAIRIKSISHFEKEIVSLLSLLGMQHAEFKIDHLLLDTPSSDGLDKIRFFFSANKGIPLNDISKIASGGEQSRLMLSIKSMILQKNLLPTIVFDEIDNGVSGDIAGKVGEILLKMSRNIQVIVITHIPQIAGKGDHHYYVYKTITGGTSRSGIRRLNRKERIEEIAKMLSDKQITAAGYQAANELLRN